MKVNKTVKRLVITGLSIFSLLASTNIVVNAMEVYDGGYDVQRPVTWNQYTAPYKSKEFKYCRTGTFGACSCGVHSIASLMLKTEEWEVGKTALDAYDMVEEKKVLANYGGMPAYSWNKMTQATDGKVKYIANHWVTNNTTSHTKIKEELEKGHYMILSVEMNGSSHLVLVDYIDDKGDIVIIDSGRRAKYLKDMDNKGWVRNITVFESELDSNESARFWEGDAVGKAGRKGEIKEIKDEIRGIEVELGKKEETEEDAKENVLKVFEELAEDKEENNFEGLGGKKTTERLKKKLGVLEQEEEQDLHEEIETRVVN